MRSRGRRAVAVLILCAVAGLSACGSDEPPDEMVDMVGGAMDCTEDSCPEGFLTYTPLSDAPIPTQEPVPTESPTYEAPPPLDRTELDANLAKLSTADRELFDRYRHDTSLGEGTYVVAAPMTVEEARARLLGPNPRPATAADEKAVMNGRLSAYTFLQVGDGVLAFEDTGFADPPRRLLAELSRDGAVSAVATDNIEGMIRFGYARDGEVVFDAFEYAFVEDLDEIPAEVRDLAALAWDDLEGPMVETADWVTVAMAMSEKVTGVRATGAVWKSQEWYVVPLPWTAGG